MEVPIYQQTVPNFIQVFETKPRPSNQMVVAVKVFKKTTPNGKVTVYLGKRDFIDHLDHTDPIDGVVVVENDYLQGRRVYGQLVTTYRYGREEDEVMGVKFSKEMVIASDQIVPKKKDKDSQPLTAIQEKLIKKMGPNAYPFTFTFPDMAPCSVTLQPGEDDQGKPLGVEYQVKCYVGSNEEDKGRLFCLILSNSCNNYPLRNRNKSRNFNFFIMCISIFLVNWSNSNL